MNGQYASRELILAIVDQARQQSNGLEPWPDRLAEWTRAVLDRRERAALHADPVGRRCRRRGLQGDQASDLVESASYLPMLAVGLNHPGEYRQQARAGDHTYANRGLRQHQPADARDKQGSNCQHSAHAGHLLVERHCSRREWRAA